MMQGHSFNYVKGKNLKLWLGGGWSSLQSVPDDLEKEGEDCIMGHGVH